MGNSEVGHLNLGAGAVVKQDLTRIDEAVARRRRSAPTTAIRAAFDGFERVHLIGLVSDGGVHSSLEHLEALHRSWRAERRRTSSSTRSPTGATRRRTAARRTSRRSSAGARAASAR